MQPLKIGITCYPTYGGSGVVATELGKALAEKGHIIHFISYSLPFRLRTFSENVFYHEVDVNSYPLFEYPPYSISLASKMAEVMCYEDLDLVHVHYAIPHAISAFLAREIQRDRASLTHQCKEVKIVTTLHGTDITLVGSDPSLRGAVRLGINQSDMVTTVSEYLKRKTIEDFSPLRPIHVVKNFVDTTEFCRKADSERFRAAFATKDERILIHLSNFRPLKRVKDVIRIFEKVHREIPSRLLLVGDGVERTEAEHLTRDLKISDCVRFLGKQEAVVELLSISDVMLMPSESESFGLAALEAMSCGVPVVSSNVGGLPELVKHGVNGFLFDVGAIDLMASAVLHILDSPERWQFFSDNARKTAIDLDTKNIIPIYEQLYLQTLTQ
ncbi:MAG: N-acetyl-alpha-D-glucosaminyl L-malate synthase BshA [Chlorobiales bacterium]